MRDHSDPKAVVYRLAMPDGSHVEARERHMRPAIASDGFRFDRGERVWTPLGPGTVREQAMTPLGNTYRVDMAMGGEARDFIEHELSLARSTMVAGAGWHRAQEA